MSWCRSRKRRRRRISYGGGVEGARDLRPTGPGGQARSGSSCAARVVRGRPRSNLLGQEPIDRPVHARQPAFARRLVTDRATGCRSSRDGQRLRLQRIPRARDLPRAEACSTRRRHAASPAFSTRRCDRASTSGRARCVAKRRALDAPSQRCGTLFVRAHHAVRPAVRARGSKPLIDRLFPQVRLSKFSNSLIRDSRDDLLDPSTRSVPRPRTASLAARADRIRGRLREDVRAGISSTTACRRQAHRAGDGRTVGLAHGFPRIVQTVDAGRRRPSQTDPAGSAGQRAVLRRRRHDGSRLLARSPRHRPDDQLVRISDRRQWRNRPERRAAHRCGQGTGGRRRSSMQATSFRTRATWTSPTCGPAAGFGVHYKSPIGPVRVELGFNLAAARARARRPRAPDRPAHFAGPGLLGDATTARHEPRRHGGTEL